MHLITLQLLHLWILAGTALGLSFLTYAHPGVVIRLAYLTLPIPSHK